MTNENQYELLDLKNKEEVLRQIKQFEVELSAELNQPVSLVAYTPGEVEELGHA